ncbi:unnamed protein product [Wuchereria bancrofti]|uniref:Uncharacterized protein n=1 Tax=Wuchereria bancrofti TaxID=6293 RepID=A0A3P7E776_WUCBA|nr:unnamed protein product [Wuchereria bancrofti]
MVGTACCMPTYQHVAFRCSLALALKSERSSAVLESMMRMTPLLEINHGSLLANHPSSLPWEEAAVRQNSAMCVSLTATKIPAQPLLPTLLGSSPLCLTDCYKDTRGTIVAHPVGIVSFTVRLLRLLIN